MTILIAACQQTVNPLPPAVFDPTNTTYTIEGKPITLVNGKSVQTASSSETSMTTTIFGEPAVGDLNGDGAPDAAVMLTQETGGSGVFFFVAAAINVKNATKGTNAILLGDRIAPQNIAVTDGRIRAKYAERKAGEPMTTQPSVGVSTYFTYEGSVLMEMSPMVGNGEHCGGNMMNAPRCMAGYHCEADACEM